MNIINLEKCCGCHACMNICPQNAISMQEDNKGFKYPVIDEKKCIKCNLCKKVCPVINNKNEEEKKIDAYACYNKNEIERKNSSSGGIFIMIAKEIIRRKGVVFGAAFDNNYNVKHCFIEKEKDLKKIMGSKYVQSEIGDMYKIAREFLKNDRYVLFTGTPCQIEGLKTFLKKDYDKLYTQDIICHGVPSPLVWNKYMEYRKKEDGKIPKEISFRNKDDGWKSFNMKFTYDKGSYKMSQTKDLYMQAFLKDTILRESCYNCCFKKKYRVSDITLADYWGIDNVHKNMNDNKGISLMIINNDKGKEIFDLIKENIIFEKTDLDNAIIYNPALIKSAKIEKNREKFFKHLNTMDFSKLIKKYTNKKTFLQKVINKIKKIR